MQPRCGRLAGSPARHVLRMERLQRLRLDIRVGGRSSEAGSTLAHRMCADAGHGHGTGFGLVCLVTARPRGSEMTQIVVRIGTLLEIGQVHLTWPAPV